MSPISLSSSSGWNNGSGDVGDTLLGSEVDKPSKILIKITSTLKYIELDIQDTKTPITNHLIIKYV